MKGVYELTLRVRDGRERKLLQWLPTPAAGSYLCESWSRRGLQVTIDKQIL